MHPHGRRRGRHPGAEGRWDAMTVLSSIPFCPYNGRRMSLRYLPAAARYMTEHPMITELLAELQAIEEKGRVEARFYELIA